MPVQKTIEDRLISIKQLGDLPDLGRPCLSIYLSAYSPGNDSVPVGARLHAALETARHELRSATLPAGEQELLLRSMYGFAQSAGKERHREGMAVFCAAGFVCAFRTPFVVRESVHLMDTFYIKPLLSALMHRGEFCILALSQKHVRLLKCTHGEVKPVALPDSLPKSVEQAGAFDAPDHDLEGRSAAGPSSGTGTRIHFGTNTAEEKTDAHIHDFFEIIDREINRLFSKDVVPIVVAAVVREMALYRKVSKYPNLLDAGIAGSPDRIADSELYRLALNVLDIQEAADEQRLLLQFSDKESKGLTLTDLPSILMAARRGQVHHLLLSDESAEEDEISNLAALETIRHDGKVSLLLHSKLPAGRPGVAMLRYQATDRSS